MYLDFPQFPNPSVYMYACETLTPALKLRVKALMGSRLNYRISQKHSIPKSKTSAVKWVKEW